MGAQTRAWLLVGLSFIVGCTKDFSRFQFRDAPPAVKQETAGTAGNASRAGSESALGRTEIGGTTAKPMAGASGSATGGRLGGNSQMDAGAAKAGTAATSSTQAGAGGRGAVGPADEDAGMQPDAQMPIDASQPPPPPDAGPSIEQQCSTSATRELEDLDLGCTNCACSSCAASVLPCLEQGDSIYDRPCRDLLKCAATHGCHDWDCYCSTSGCRSNSEADGNGPCFEEMNAAAGDTRDRAAVNAAHSAKDPSNPMIMAIKATSCMLGAEHGSVMGACESACDIR